MSDFIVFEHSTTMQFVHIWATIFSSPNTVSDRDNAATVKLRNVPVPGAPPVEHVPLLALIRISIRIFRSKQLDVTRDAAG